MSTETKVTHTPGPWHPSPTGHFVNGETPGQYIADCSLIDDSEIARANARLISAAPTMLDALQFIANRLREFDGETPCGLTPNGPVTLLEIAEEVIAKAKNGAA